MKKTFTILSLGLLTQLFSQYDNGPLSTGTIAENGTPAPNGYTFSELQSDGIDVNNTAGYTGDQAQNYMLSDDFRVPDGESWGVSSVELFVYKTDYLGNCPIVSTNVFFFDHIHGSNVTFPQSVSSCQNTQMLRVFNSVKEAGIFDANITKRQIYKFTIPVSNVNLEPGYYSLRFQTQAGGTHFYPAVTVPGARNNITELPAQQSSDNGVNWTNIIDPGYANIEAEQDLPFIINYSALGTNEMMSLDNRIKLYPNPAKEHFSAFLPDNFNRNNLKISVKDLTGKMVMNFTQFQEEFNISSLPKGIYVVTVSDGKNINTNKLIKQ
ncbi:T9SS type A sorting domain-containing protein [Moheibacter sediminis]|uniref:Por secretion system C-terminal sorting domain-containing protein n=1 Tax=Moheibacter sediminis TaxID=1434700 RepID=A0A1W1ZR24_9FLAO|nr:T9SS type A sorting domain-containing protein [Moheibacter sediminis]SMC50548.1 Por secretion system C-terminal sorting domain-containing protein [Moheibacter sediminis]